MSKVKDGAMDTKAEVEDYLESLLVTLRHTDVRDLSASLLQDVCSNVCREPSLQPLSGESLHLRSASTDDGARLDIAVDGFWGNRYQRAFFDVRVFCPLSSYYQSKSLKQCYRDNESLKKRKYEQRIRDVEHGCFSPLVFSTLGDLALYQLCLLSA
uniref:Uncharacterized protein n=1 Tax=Amphimedon queenslandica TaxID=400682 RepID=A0A1X7U7S0_AMPQE